MNEELKKQAAELVRAGIDRLALTLTSGIVPSSIEANDYGDFVNYHISYKTPDNHFISIHFSEGKAK